MFIKQKRFGSKRIFDFKDSYVLYRTEDEASGLKKKIDYLEFPSRDEHFEYCEKLVLFLFLGCGFLGVGTIQYVLTEFFTGSPRWSMGTIGLILMAIYFFSNVRYTAISTSTADVTIMKDKQHDIVLNEIYNRRGKILREKYASVRHDSCLEDEFDKFAYLYKEEAISELEMDELRSQAAAYYGNNDSISRH